MSLVFFLNNSPLYFSTINNFLTKNFFFYLSKEWFIVYIILLRWNSLYYNSSLVEIVGFDSFMQTVNKSYLSYIYIFFNYFHRNRLFLSFSASYKYNLNTISSFFYNAQWPEREVSEMFGSFFFNKKDNRKLLLDYSHIGFPLLKLYPLSGYVEIIFTFTTSWLITTPINYVKNSIDETSFLN